jgi:hypothetical protein
MLKAFSKKLAKSSRPSRRRNETISFAYNYEIYVWSIE